ncbi:DNA alkylation response protein [Mycobacterium colombiense]|uniref:DNA alkylation response protein n=1 Tax=Mycobacterium colombiense TaxID=339268 RepID=A0A329KYE2_9MYCO|nr:acyl-CoA dehydrogenase family protein [Mycobacterium colombiense]RAV00794.1 DNA alkylation response protein [Mycobacterium colombiense]
MTATHEVFNQAPPRVGVNEFDSNIALTEAVECYGIGWATDQLSDVGELVGQADFQRDADLANTYSPVFVSHDRLGNRVDAVDFHPAYHRVICSAIRYGAHTSCWADPRPGAHIARAVTYMLFAQVEPGHTCPVGMTHSVVPSLRLAPDLAQTWLPRVYSRTYDPELRAPDTKASAIFGMAMTEKQGGSDVRTNTTRAVDAKDGTWRLTGHKWFCSAPQSDAFLMLAQTPGGLSCFLVPRMLPDGSCNEFRIQRLKDKLGNKSNASAEIELEDTTGWLIGEAGCGVRTIIEMVSQTRLDCVLMSAAGMRQSVAEAAWHCRNRSAFGAMLIHQPAMTSVIADLQLEAEAATWTALRLAAAYDSDDDESVAFRRLATPVAKYWVCKRGPHHAYEALECLGGNGYSELFPLARRYREQPLMAIWEGSGNVIALDVLRAIAREPHSVEAFDREICSALGQYPEFDKHIAHVRESVRHAGADAAAAQGQARRLVESLALALQASIVIREAPSAVADAFVAARMSDDRHLEYGALATRLDLRAIVARA